MTIKIDNTLDAGLAYQIILDILNNSQRSVLVVITTIPKKQKKETSTIKVENEEGAKNVLTTLKEGVGIGRERITIQ
jgi:hypothetical protein